jgi:hypothetical protein
MTRSEMAMAFQKSVVTSEKSTTRRVRVGVGVEVEEERASRVIRAATQPATARP